MLVYRNTVLHLLLRALQLLGAKRMAAADDRWLQRNRVGLILLILRVWKAKSSPFSSQIDLTEIQPTQIHKYFSFSYCSSLTFLCLSLTIALRVHFLGLSNSLSSSLPKGDGYQGDRPSSFGCVWRSLRSLVLTKETDCVLADSLVDCLALALNLRMRGRMQGRRRECSQVASSSGKSFHLTRQQTLLLKSLRSRTASTSQKARSFFWPCIITIAGRIIHNHYIYRQMAYRDPYARPNDTYNSIQQIDPNLQLHRPSNTYVPTQPRIDNSPQTRWQPDYSQRGSYQVEPAKKSQIKNRIKEIMELCRGENSAINSEMAGIIRQEREVYDLLGRADNESFRPPAPVGPSSQLTPHRQDAGSTLQRDVKSMIYQNSHIQLPEEAHQLINAIEQKALAEIQKARNQVDQYKRRNAELEKELAYYRSQGAPGGAGYQNELRSKVAYLEGLLEQQRSSGSSGGIDFNALYAQGQAIRQDTLRLLRLKQARLGGSDDEEKGRLREEVQRLQRRVEQLQHERVGVGRPSKPSYEVINEEYSPIAPAYKRSNSHRNSANQYESLVMEMRKITAN